MFFTLQPVELEVSYNHINFSKFNLFSTLFFIDTGSDQGMSHEGFCDPLSMETEEHQMHSADVSICKTCVVILDC